jgi:hypothetical protein
VQLPSYREFCYPSPQMEGLQNSAKVSTEAIQRLPLEEQIVEWAHSPAADEVRVGILYRTLGWEGTSLSLREAAEQLHMSPEGVRQARQRFISSLGDPPEDLTSSLLDVLNMSANLAPVRESRLLDTLKAQGFITGSMTTRGLLSLARAAGISPAFQYSEGYVHKLHSLPPPATKALASALVECKSVGVCEIRHIAKALGAPNDWAVQDLVSDVTSSEWAVSLGGGWFCSRLPRKRERLTILARRLIAACGPLNVGVLRQGLEKQQKFGRLPRVPPEPILSGYFGQRPDFLVRGSVVRGSKPLEAEAELTPTELPLYQALKSSPDHVLDREQLRMAALAAGTSLNAFRVCLQSSPMFETRGRGRWALLGVGGSKTTTSSRLRKQTPSATRYTWNELGQLVVESILHSPETTVFKIPSSVSPILEGSEFSARDTLGKRMGVIKIRGGRSWGFEPFLRKQGGSAGQVLSVAFDLTTREATLQVTNREVDDARSA